MSYYHYQRGVEHGCSWPIFFARMFVFDVLFIILLLNVCHLYRNYQAQHDEQLLRSWCHQVLCVRIDPATGIGTPAIPEPTNLTEKVNEI